MFNTSLWTSDRALTFHAVRRRTHDGCPYQDSIIAYFSRLVNTFLKKCICIVIKNEAYFTGIYTTMYKREGNNGHPQGLRGSQGGGAVFGGSNEGFWRNAQRKVAVFRVVC